MSEDNVDNEKDEVQEIVEPVTNVEETEPEVESESTNEDDPKADDTETVEENPEVVKLKQRVNKVTKQKHQERIAKEKLQAENAELKQKQTQFEAEKTPEPKLEDFGDDHEGYLKALSDHTYKQNRMKENADTIAQNEKATAESKKASAMDNFDTQADEAREKYDDFDAIALAEEVPYSDATTELVLGSPASAEIAYYLGKHLDVAEELAAMSPLEAAKAIGKLEDKLTVVKKKTESAAPDPINPIISGGDPVQKDPSKMNIDEWMAWDKRQSIEKIKSKLNTGALA